jgi:preprotein translocase subunit SecA
VPEDEWQRTVQEIESKEKMKEEGRKVAEMGGLHIVGTERHEARRIDNQLRGRAGRQGDPGSSRFFLSLQDDLMRIFAGEWVAKVLTRLGMEEGQAIESGMVSKRIQAAQKKVEERNFDIRKHLLEYDEVMDYQRKRVYGYRQEILEGANCKVRMLTMLDAAIDLAVDRFLDDEYGPGSFAEFAGNRLGVDFDAGDFLRSDYTEAEKTARDKAARQIQTQVQEMLEENLGSEDEKEWNWQALAQQVNARWGLKTGDRELKKIGKDELGQFLIDKANAAIDAVDLAPGQPFLEADWGRRSVCDWARLKFQIAVTVQELTGKNDGEVKELLRAKVRELYRQKEIEFPVQVGMARFMAERAGGPAAQRYDREGLCRWAAERFPGLVRSAAQGDGQGNGSPTHHSPLTTHLTEEDFRTQSRARLREALLGASRALYPKVTQDDIDARLEESFRGTKLSEAEDARELTEWMRAQLGIEVPLKDLTGVTEDSARQLLWNAFDERFRPEMRGMERSLLLNQLDSAWKNHLYTMDHLRSSVGLMGYAQLDPKTEYKRQGMKEFEGMWEGVQDKVTEAVFRMEEAEGFQESLWTIGATIHETAPRALLTPQPQTVRGQQDQAIANSQKSEKKPEPIRNRGERVGRNDPCPCGSGKKYKNCHMREESGVRR